MWLKSLSQQLADPSAIERAIARVVWKGATLTIHFRQPFDMLLDAATIAAAKQSAHLGIRGIISAP
jgi:hypothetical protein